MPIKWREQMSVDQGIIDADHRHLIDIVNQFELIAEDGLTTEEALQVLYSLQFYASTHFVREEQLQRLAEFPFSDAHAREHAELKAKLNAIIDETRSHQNTVEVAVAKRISELLRHWLLDHILDSDLRMKVCVAEIKTAGANLGALKDLEYTGDVPHAMARHT